MENLQEAISSYMKRIRNTSFELMRDPYMALADCLYIKKEVKDNLELSPASRRIIGRELRDLEDRAQADWFESGYGIFNTTFS